MRVCTASLSIPAFIGVILCSQAAVAQQQEGRSFKLGEADVVPAVEIEYITDSNAFLEPTDEVEATAVIVSPEIQWRADRRLLILTAGYSGEYASYSEDSLNYDDHLLEFAVRSDFTAKRRLGVDISFANEHEALGTENTRGQGALFGSPVESNQFSVDANYTYGANTARGNLTGGLRVDMVGYTEPDGGGTVTEGDDFSMIRPYGILSLRLSPDTRLLTELQLSQFDFDADSRDRTELTLLAGVAFSGTGKSGGSAKLGGTLATFAEEAIDDQTELVADVSVFFLPRTYSRLTLAFTRELDNLSDPDSADGDNLIQATRDRGQFSWRHDWTERFNTIARADVRNIDRDCLNDVLITSARVEANVLPRRWMELGVSGGVEERTGSSNDCAAETTAPDELDYEQQVIGAHVRITL